MQDASTRQFKHQSGIESASRLSQARSLAMVSSRAVVGVTAHPVIVEVHLANGLPAFSTVGLPEAVVKESKDRVRGALLNSGFEFPAKRITVNLSPADLPKHGSRFDLPIAIGILAASGQIPAKNLQDYEFVGELALDGQLRPVVGVLPTALAMTASEKTLIAPHQNSAEAALVKEASSLSAAHLIHVCQHLAGQDQLSISQPNTSIAGNSGAPDINEVKGQEYAKRALEVAAAGGHSILFVGPPGTGKSMLAARLPGIMPPLSNQEALESAAIYSVSQGHFDAAQWMQRPFRSPHHSASSAALVGGGSNPRPGEISLAHNGILFLDELTEFSRATLEQLREPLETGLINISRASQQVQYPADFLLIAACNPCKCGYFGDGTDRCQCSATSIEKYKGKLSGPLLDRIDMTVYLKRLSASELRVRNVDMPSSVEVQSRVSACYNTQITRQGCSNSSLSGSKLERYCTLEPNLLHFFEMAVERLQLSARAYHRVIRLARTIADLDASSKIQQPHIAEALGYRRLI